MSSREPCKIIKIHAVCPTKLEIPISHLKRHKKLSLIDADMPLLTGPVD